MKDSYIIAIYLTRLIYPYRPFLDDYIQYRVYSLYPNPTEDIFLGAGTFTTRPAANFLDLVLFSKAGYILYLPYIFLVLMYLGFVLMLRKLLDNMEIRTGSVFLLTALLCPLNIEGTVWISAATRIIPGLFLAASSMLIILHDKATPGKIILFYIINLMSFLFYEQTFVFVILTAIMVSLRKKSPLPAIVSLINGALMGTYYFIFRNYGVFSHRLSPGKIDIAGLISGLKSCIFASGHTLVQGGVVVLIAAVPIFFAVKKQSRAYFSLQKLLLGGGIALLSLLPPLLAGMYEIPFRCLVIPLIGIALVLDCIKKKRVCAMVTAVLVAAFTLSSAMEFRKYDISTRKDEKIISEISTIIALNPQKSVSIYNGKRYYTASPGNHAEHIAAITSSDWAITGALRATLKNPVYPVVGMGTEADINIHIKENGIEITKGRAVDP